MTREKFCELWDKAGLTDDNLDKLNHITTAITEHFYIINDYDDEEILFIEKSSYIAREPVMFGWYKIMHLGRDLFYQLPEEYEDEEGNVFETEDDMMLDSLKLLKEDLDKCQKKL